MTIDVDVALSPGWWMLRLARKLEQKHSQLELLDSHYRGDPPLPEGAAGAKSAYQAFQKKARLNLAELSADAVLDRMIPTGFQTGASNDENGDEMARKIWVTNGLEVESAEVHRNMLVLRDGYVIVGGPDPDTGIPVITAEDPRQVVTFHDPAQQRKIRAALKLFHDPEQGRDFAYLFLPGRVFVASNPASRTTKHQKVNFSAGWNWDDNFGGETGHPLPTGNESQMPVVRFRNKSGLGEFETHIHILDRINHMILQRMVIATFQAFRQRAIQVDPKDMPDKDPETGELIDYDKIFTADPGALWKLPATATMWESSQVDLGPILAAVKDDIHHFCAVTRTPLFYVTPDAANGSAMGAALMREGLIFKAEDRIRRASAGWNQVMALAFRFMNDDKRAELTSLRTLWQPAERFSLAERADAATKAGTDIPWAEKMTSIWQYPPEKVAEMQAAHDAEVEAAKPPPPIAPPPVPIAPPEPIPAPVPSR